MNTISHKGTEYRILTSDDLNSMNFDIPVWHPSYSEYFNEKDQLIISTGFLAALKRGIFENGEWHHLFYGVSDDNRDVKKVSMEVFFKFYSI